MLELMTQKLDFHAAALQLRAERQKLLASNIANADTPGFKARDFNFAAAMAQVNQAQTGTASAANGLQGSALPMQRTSAAHVPAAGQARAASLQSPSATAAFRVNEQASIDGNSVDMDKERANFLDNSLRYESTLRFMNSNIRTMLTAIKGE